MSNEGNEDGAKFLPAAVVGGDNDNNITISHKRGEGTSDMAVAKVREVMPAKHGECSRNRTRRRRGGEVIFDQ